MHTQKLESKAESKRVVSPSFSSAMFLKPEAFNRPVEIKEDKSAREAFLEKFYGEPPKSHEFDKTYESQVKKLCGQLYEMAKEYKIKEEWLSNITAFPDHLFGFCKTNKETTPYETIKLTLEKIFYLISVKKTVNPDEIKKEYEQKNIKLSSQDLNQLILIKKAEIEHEESRKKTALEMLLEAILVCNTGLMGKVDAAHRFLISGDSLEHVWSALRTNWIQQFSVRHISEKKITQGNEAHVPIVLMKYAMQWGLGISTEMNTEPDQFEKVAGLTPEILNKFKTEFFDFYQLRLMTDSLVEKFVELLERRFKNHLEMWKENDLKDWFIYSAKEVKEKKRDPLEISLQQILAYKDSLFKGRDLSKVPFREIAEKIFERQDRFTIFGKDLLSTAEDILKDWGLDSISSSELFETKQDPPASIRFSKDRLKKSFWRFCQKQDRFVEKQCWEKATGAFENHQLMYCASPGFGDFTWIENEGGDLIMFDDLPNEEKMRYYIYSFVKFGFVDHFHLVEKPPREFEIFKEKETLIQLAKALEEENQLGFHQSFLKGLFQEYSHRFCYFLLGLSDKNIRKVLGLTEIDFMWIHEKNPLHEKAKNLPMSDAASEKDLDKFMVDYMISSQDHFDHFKSENKIEKKESPILYSTLVKCASDAKQVGKQKVNENFVYAMYMRHYFPSAYQKVSSKEEVNYVYEFKVAHENSIKSLNEKNRSIFSYAKDGNLEGLKSIGFSIGDIFIKDNDGDFVINWLYRCVDQSVLDFYYNSVACLYSAAADNSQVGPFNAPLLFWAVTFNQQSVIDILLSNENINVNISCSDKETTLFAVARLGHLDVCRALCERGAKVDAARNDDVTPLFVACQNGHLEVARYLCERGAKVNAARNDGITPLYIACWNGHLEVVRYLCERGAKVDAAKNDGVTPLIIACEKGHLEVARYLCERGAKVNAAKNDGVTPLYIACQNGHLEVVRYLCERGAKVDAATNNGATPFFIACQEGHLEVARYLCERGAKVDAARNDGVTPLYIACQNGHLEVARYLCERGAKVDAAGNDDVTPLHIACQNGDLEVARSLCERGAKVDAAMNNGATPLFIACLRGHLEVVRYLCERGAKVDAAIKDGVTPLHIACQNGDLEVARSLCERGAKVDAATNNGATPLFIACQRGHLEVVRYLCEQGAKANLAFKGCTPLMAALDFNSFELVQILLNAGADPSLLWQNKKLSEQTKNIKIKRLLLSREIDFEIEKILKEKSEEIKKVAQEFKPQGFFSSPQHDIIFLPQLKALFEGKVRPEDVDELKSTLREKLSGKYRALCDAVFSYLKENKQEPEQEQKQEAKKYDSPSSTRGGRG